VLKTPFGRGLATWLGLVDAIVDGLAAVEPVAADTPAEGMAVPPPQPDMARPTIPLTSSRFALRMGSLLMWSPRLSATYGVYSKEGAPGIRTRPSLRVTDGIPYWLGLSG
jgi:hypothetical protein